MISFLTKQYIRKRTTELCETIPKNYLETLQNIEKRKLPDGIHLKFGGLFNRGKNINAYAGFGKCIVLNPEYATMLILYNDNELEDALDLTIGHELTHKDGQLVAILGLSKIKITFIAWVNEVHADFGGAQKMTDSSCQKLLRAMIYKSKLNPNSEDCTNHPSWERRIKYAENFDFTPKLIDQIAKDVGYSNQEFVNKVKACGFYKDIILHD